MQCQFSNIFYKFQQPGFSLRFSIFFLLFPVVNIYLKDGNFHVLPNIEQKNLPEPFDNRFFPLELYIKYTKRKFSFSILETILKKEKRNTCLHSSAVINIYFYHLAYTNFHILFSSFGWVF